MAGSIVVLVALSELITPLSDLSVAQWAAENRRLPSSTVAPGKWDNARTPYLSEIMNCMSASDDTRVVVVMAGAQIGKSEAGYNTIGYWIDQNPSNIILTMPTDMLSQMISRDRIDPLLDLTPCLKHKVAAKGSRKSNNTIKMKDFIGGKLLMITAKSAPSLRAIAARHVVADEVDAYPDSVGAEGDPLGLLMRRTSTFGGNYKMLITSTPLIKNHSRIENNFNLTDKRRYYVPCRKCANMDFIKWDNIVYDPESPGTTAQLRCEKCGTLHDESDKVAMLSGGEWRATAKTKQEGWVGYHLSALYSPHGWYSWGRAAMDYENSKKDEAARQVWVNTVLGETYEYYAYRPTLTLKTADPQSYGKDKQAPRDVLTITAGVDTQNDRVEMYVWGWAKGEKPRLIDYLMMAGDLTEWAFWQDFHSKYKSLEYITADGRRLKISAAAIDSGGLNTLDVYRYALRCRKIGDKTIAIKGVSGNKDIITHKIIRHKPQKRGKEIQVDLFRIGVDNCKKSLYEKIEKKELVTPFAFANGELVPDEFYLQLTAEEFQTRVKAGRVTRKWEKVRARNEAMDCYNYAFAALKYLDVRWAALEKQQNELARRAGATTAAPTTTAAVPSGTPKPPAKRRVIIHGGNRPGGGSGPRRRRF